MAKTRTEIVLGLKKLRNELRKAEDQGLRQACMTGIDDLLDERLEAKGVHPADCSCHACCAHVAEVLAARRLGECVDSRDIATDGSW